jgi:hypothetical protein
VKQLIKEGVELMSKGVKFEKQIVITKHKKCTIPLIKLETGRKYELGIHTVHGETQDVKIALRNISWQSLLP